MGWKIWDREGLALAVATMVFEPYSNKRVALVFYAVLVLFKLSLLADVNLLTADTPTLKDYDLKFKGTLAARNNLLMTFFGVTDVVNYLKDNNVYLLYVALVGGLFWLLLSSLTLLNFSRFKKWAFGSSGFKPETPFYFRPLTMMIYNYDYFFLLIVNVFILSMTCIKFPVESGSNATQSGIIKVGEERAAGESTVTRYERACGLNKGIGCMILNHYFVCFLCGLILICSFWLKFCSQLVMSYCPDPSVMFSTYGSMSNFHTLMITLLLIGKSYLLNTSEVTSTMIDTYYITSLSLMTFDLFIHCYFVPYYSKVVHKVRIAENLLLMIMSLIVLLLRRSTMSLVFSLNQSLVFASLLFTIALKVTLNFENRRANLQRLPSFKSITGEDLARIAYTGLQFVERSLASGHEDKEQLETVVFFSKLRNLRAREALHDRLNASPAPNVLGMIDASHKVLTGHAIKSAGASKLNVEAPESLKELGETKRMPFITMEKVPLDTNKTVTVPRLSIFQTDKDASKKGSSIVKKKNKTNGLNPIKIFNMASEFENKGSAESHIDEQTEDFLTPTQKMKSLISDASIFEKFEELRESNTKDILVLMSTITDECFERLARSSSASLSTVREALTIAVFICINYLGNIPLALQKLHMTQLLFKRSKGSEKLQETASNRKKSNFHSSVSDSLRLEVIRSLISLTLRHNSETGELVLRSMRSKMSNTVGDQSKMKLFSLLEFLNKYGQLKEDVQKAVEIKQLLFSSISENKKVKFSEVFKKSKAFNLILDSLGPRFQHLKNQSDSKFTSLTLVEGYYLAHLQQDIKKGYAIIDKTVSRGISSNYNMVNFDSKVFRRIEEKVAVGASGEQSDFHQITFASSNIRLFLGYEVSNILKKDLAVIIPEPLKSKHAAMLSSKGATGVILENLGPIPVVAVDAEEMASLCRLVVRLNYLLDNGLQYLGFLDFSLGDKDECMVLLDSEGKITNTNLQAYKYLEPKSFISKYNPSFIGSFKELDSVAAFLLENEKTGMESMMSNPRMYTYSSNYYKMSTGREIEIKDKNKRIRKIHFLVNDYYIYRLNAKIRCFHFNPSRAKEDYQNAIASTRPQFRAQQAASDSDDSGPAQDSDSRKSAVSSLLQSLKDEDCLRMANKLLFDYRRQDRVTSVLEAIEKRLRIVSFLEQPILKMTKTFGFNAVDINDETEEAIESRSTVHQLVPEIKKNTPLELTAYSRFGLFLDYWYTKRKMNLKKKAFTELSTYQGFIGIFNKNLFKQIAKRKMEMHVGSIATKNMFIENRTKYKLSRILENKLNYGYLNFKTGLIGLILLLTAGMQFGLGYYRFSLGQLVNDEVRYKLVASDLNSWVIWSTAMLVLVVDTSRQVYEGVLKDDTLRYLGGLNLTQANTMLKRTMTGTLQGIGLQYRFIMQNVSLPIFHDADRYSRHESIENWLPGNVDWMDPPGYANWSKVNLTFYESVGLNQPLSELYFKRNDTTFSGGKIGMDRDKDLLAEMLRRNLGNQLLEVLIEDQYDVGKYFMGICKFNSFLSSYGDALQFTVMACVATFVLILIFTTRSKMSKFYSMLFEVKVNQIYVVW